MKNTNWMTLLLSTAIGLSVTICTEHLANACSTCTNCSCLDNVDPDTGTILNPHIYVVFWGTDWGQDCSLTSCPNDTLGRIPQLLNLLQGGDYQGSGYWGGLPGTRWLGVETQYNGYLLGDPYVNQYYYNQTDQVINIPGGAAPWFDYTATPNPINIGDLQQEATRATQWFDNFGLNIEGDGNALFLIAVGPTSNLAYCGVHGALSPTTPPAFLSTIYQYDTACDYAYESLAGVSASVAQYAGLVEHELTEAITDPLTQFDKPYATWQTGSGAETADACQNIGFPEPMVEVATQTSNFPFAVQTVVPRVSNKAGASGGCVFARTTDADVFTLGGDSHLYHQNMTADSAISNGSWYDWGNLGTSGALVGDPASVSWAPGRKDVFVWDNSYHLRHAYTDSTNVYCRGPDSPCYDDWGQLPPDGIQGDGWYPVGAPSVASWGPGRLDIFATGTSLGYDENDVFHRIWDNGSDSGWVDVGGPAGNQADSHGPAATTYSPGAVDVFVVGDYDGAIYHGVYNQNDNSFAWSFYHAAPAQLSDAVDAVSWLPGRLDVMAVDVNGVLWDCGADTTNGVLTPWTDCSRWTPPYTVRMCGQYQCILPVHFRSKPTIAALGDQRLIVSAVDDYYNVGWMQLWDFGQSTGGWTSTGGYLPAGLDLSSW